jgi:hypothetical protein
MPAKRQPFFYPLSSFVSTLKPYMARCKGKLEADNRTIKYQFQDETFAGSQHRVLGLV